MFILGIYLDSVLFNRLNINGIRPDAVMALIASYGLLAGSLKGALAGAAAGLVFDVLFSGMVGPSAIGYMLCGAIGGLFYQKYYADNLIIPALVAAAGSLIKDNIMAVARTASGAHIDYFNVLATYMLPCMLMTMALCMIIHNIIKRILTGQVRSSRKSANQIGGEK